MPESVLCLNVRENNEVLLLEFIQFTDSLDQIVVRPSITCLVAALPGKSEAKEIVDVILVFLISDPIIMKNHQCMNAIAAIFDGQLNPRHQANVFLSRGFTQCLEFVAIEFVVIGDDTDLNSCLL